MSRLLFFSKASVVVVIFLLIMLLIVIYFIIKPELSNNVQNIDDASKVQLSLAAETVLQKQIEPLIAAGNIQACDAVSNESYKLVCKNNIVLNQAEKTGDVSLCQQIDNVMVPRAFCESQVVLEKSVSTNNIQVCMEATDSDVQKSCTDAFNQRTAARNSVPSMCDTSEAGDSCRLNEILLSLTQAPQTANCSQLRAVNEKTECVAFKEVLVRGNFDANALAKVCEGFETTLFKNVCNILSKPTVSIQ